MFIRQIIRMIGVIRLQKEKKEAEREAISIFYLFV